SYDIMLAGGGLNTKENRDRRVVRVNVDSIALSDISARLSPDGNYVAYRVSGNREDEGTLGVAEAKTGKNAAITLSKDAGHGIGPYIWSPGSNVLAFVVSPVALS